MRAPNHLQHQLQHLDLAKVPTWIEGGAQVRQRNLKWRIIPTKQPQGKMKMSVDMSLPMQDVINAVLGAQAPADWEEQ